MELDGIRKEIKAYLDRKGLKLFDVSYRKADAILEVLIDEELDMDTLEEVSGEISGLLDAHEDEFAGNYYLDVSTVGAERPIRNEQELADAVGSYIYVKLKKEEYYGYLSFFADGVAELEVKQKNIKKKVSLAYKDIKKVRYAVEF